MIVERSENDHRLIAEARRACIRHFYIRIVTQRDPEHAARQGYDLEAATQDRDAKVALALTTGASLTEIEGARSPEQ